ncbi:MAG: integrase core domain-containing protein, partial [Candidatus Pacebacteria bacterium]|nr:integrase core domain-containing protein [Candidatus Paceibacterota bacterium]
GHKADAPGALVELDTVVFYVNGMRRYIITAIDLYTRTAYAKAYKSPSSANARDFFKELETVLPFSISHIQTDNGSEFEKHFRKHVESLGIVHFNTYPRSPKMNAHIERFNGTIQREFADMHLGLLSVDMEAFQREMSEWLLWYNTERPHEGIGLVSPLWYFSNQLVA